MTNQDALKQLLPSDWWLKQIKFIDLIIKTKSYLLMGVTIERLMEKRAALEKDLERMDLTYGQRAID